MVKRLRKDPLDRKDVFMHFLSVSVKNSGSVPLMLEMTSEELLVKYGRLIPHSIYDGSKGGEAVEFKSIRASAFVITS